MHVPGKLTAVGYRVNIIQPHLIPAIDRQLELFQHDNARPRQTPLAMDYLEQNSINALPWLSKSPELNPIEQLWDHFDKRVRQGQSPSQTVDQLYQMLQQEWRSIPRNNVRKWMESMPRRCRVLLTARGGHTLH